MARLGLHLLPARSRLHGLGTVLSVGIGYLAERALTGRWLGSLREYASLVTVMVILATLLYGGPSLVKIAAICAVIFAAGLATLELLLPTDVARRDGSILRNPAFVAVGLGPATVLAVTIVLRLVGLYSLPFVLGSLMAIVVIALCSRPSLRARCRRPFQRMDSSFYVWLACTLTFLVIVAPQNDPFTKSSSVYLTQGFDLFFDKNPSEWPYFGEKFVMPMLFVTHAIGSNMALFSSGDPFEYWSYGQHWLNIIVSPLIPIGAYLAFRRMLPAWAAALAAAVFCASILDQRTWSLRGESLGWVFGFPFLVGLSDFFDYLEADRGQGPALRLALLLALLYFAMTLTHGVAAMVATLMAVGLGLCFLFSRLQWRRWRVAAIAGLPFIVGLVVLTAAYMPAFSGSVEKMFFEYDRKPIAGEQDAALLFENAITGFPDATVDPVKAGAPYLLWSSAWQIQAFLPVAAAFRPELAQLPIAHFHDSALASLAKVSPAERVIYVVLLAVCCLLYGARERLGIEARHSRIFVVCVFVYVALIAFTVYMNAVSVSAFPVAASRRTFVYAKFFYWIAVAIAVLDFIVLPLSTVARPSTKLLRAFRVTSPWRPQIVEGAVALAFLLLIGASLYSNAVSRMFGGDVGWTAWRAREIALTTLNDIRPIAPIENYFQSVFAWRKLLFDIAARPEFFDVAEYIRNHTAPNEWVYSNVISDNQFWYLTGGRYSLAEGSAMYQVYSLQYRAAARLKRFAELAKTGDVNLVDDYQVRYFLLLKKGCYLFDCYGYAAYPPNLSAFETRTDITKVYESRNYVIFARIGLPQRAVAASADTMSPLDSNAITDREKTPQSTIRGIKGWVESAVYIDGQYRIDGWAVPPQEGMPLEILTYVGGHEIARVKTGIARPDVDRVLGIRTDRPGFRIILDATQLPSREARRQVRFFAHMTDGRMQELERDADRSVLPKPPPNTNLTELADIDLPSSADLAEIERTRITAALASGLGMPSFADLAIVTDPGYREEIRPVPISRSKSIEGWIDFATLSEGYYEVGGWSVDPNEPARLMIGLYLGDRLLGTTETGLPRVDVGHYFKKKVGLPGFQFRFQASLIPSDQKHAVHFVAVSGDGSFRELICNPGTCIFRDKP
jgi:heme exporter protein D